MGIATARHSSSMICHGMETRRWGKARRRKATEKMCDDAQRNSIAQRRYGMEGPRIVQQCDGKAEKRLAKAMQRHGGVACSLERRWNSTVLQSNGME